MSADNKQILYIAYHYPPIVGSSGVHRTLAFTRFLSEQGWNVSVLTASLCAYNQWSEEHKAFIPGKVNVIRAFARSTEKHFSIKGRYLRLMALPDNFQSWILGAVIAGLKQIYKVRPQVIVSTYPIASAHIIGYLLHKITGIPWVADFRDPMAQDGYPADPLTHKVFRWIEKKAVKHCAKILFTTDGAKKFYQKKFPNVDPALFSVIPNGYDAEIFDSVKRAPESKGASGQITLLHSGVIYPSERDPRQFFQALAELKAEGNLSTGTFLLRLRAPGHDKFHANAS